MMIYNTDTKQLLKQYTNKKGYTYIYLNNANHFIHILLAKTFLKLDDSRHYNISYKDGNKNNNHKDNLTIKYKQEKEVMTLKDLTLENEIWKQINGYDHFLVSNLGRIINTEKK